MTDGETDAQLQVINERSEALEIVVGCLLRALKAHVPRAVPDARLYLLGSADRLETEGRFVGAKFVRMAASRLTDDNGPDGSPTGKGRVENGVPHLRRIK